MYELRVVGCQFTCHFPLTPHPSLELTSGMPAPTQIDPSETLRLRPMIIWSIFAAALVLGIALWFRFSGRIQPMIDALTGK